MYSGTILNFTPRANELWALLIGLKGAFLEDENNENLEADRVEIVDISEEDSEKARQLLAGLGQVGMGNR